jgi:glutathione synthase
MASSIYASYPPETPPEQQAYLVQTVKNWSAEHGLLVRPSPAFISSDVNPNGVLATNAPVTLFPSPFPKACFEQARSLQKAYNELYAAIASDQAWLEDIMKEYVCFSRRRSASLTLVDYLKLMTSSRIYGRSISR